MRPPLALTLLGLYLGLSACQPTPSGAPCDSTNCTGCCDASGACQTSIGPQACGAAGSACTSCGPGQTCGPQGTCEVVVSCTPKTCTELQATCGEVDDGCGAALSCGSCPAGESCGGGGLANACGPGTCTPRTCADLQAQCGRPSDGCSQPLSCGSCAAPEVCGGGGQPFRCGGCAVSATCAAQGKNCGSIPDGCGGSLPCGDCPVGQTCGAGGVANVCGVGTCTPTTCQAQGKNCGSISDGCGQTLACGTCGTWLTCGGGGTANLCGATCAVTCPQGFACDGLGQCAGGSLSSLVLNEVGHAVSGTVRLNGQAPAVNATFCASTPAAELAEVEFWDPLRRHRLTHSITCAASTFAWSVTLPPGAYEVRVRRGASAFPAGVNLLPFDYLVNPSLVVAGPLSGQVLNEVSHAVSGAVRVNGQAPAVNGSFCSSTPAAELAILEFYDPANGHRWEHAVRCSSPTYAFSVLLPPGRFQVRVRRGSSAFPAGSNLLPLEYLTNPSLVVAGPLANVVLDEVWHPVSGTVRVNGQAPTVNTTYCTSTPAGQLAHLELWDAARGHRLTHTITCANPNFAWSVNLPPGTFEVRVRPGSSAFPAGVNLLPLDYQALTALAVSGARTGVVLDEVAHAVSGWVRLNGFTPTHTASFCASTPNAQLAEVEFWDASRGHRLARSIPCSSPNYDWAVTLPPGTFEVRVRRGSAAFPAGVNLLGVDYLVDGAFVVSGPSSARVLNEVTHLVSGTIQRNGQAPSRNASYCTTNPGHQLAEVEFWDSSKGHRLTLSVPCSASTFSWSTPLPPGRFEVRVRRGTAAFPAGVDLYAFDYQVLAALDVTGPLASVVLNEVGRDLGGTVRLNGQAPALNTTYCSANPAVQLVELEFWDSTRGHRVLDTITCSFAYTWNATLAPGTHEVRVRRLGGSYPAGVNLLPLDVMVIERLKVP